MSRFIFYLFRWQLSTPILAAVIWWLPWGSTAEAAVANLVGACCFFWVDRWIFENRRG